MSRNRDRISFRAIAIVLSLAIACYGCIFSTPESANAAGLSPEEAALKEAGHAENGDGTGGENPAFPSDVDPLAFTVLDIQLTVEDGVSLGWSDLGTNFVYTVEYCDSVAEGNWSPCPPVEQWPTSATSWTDTSVTGSGTRFYRIHTEAQSDPPSAPVEVTAEVEGDGVVIRWSPVPGASSYNVYWSTDEKLLPTEATKLEDVSSPFTHSGLDSGVTYYYVVTAVGNKGESEVSSVVSVMFSPPLDTTVATTMHAATEFLYTGDNPLQTGVAEGTIEPVRVAVLRGRVMTREGEPLSGVSITVLNHPEYGQTLSRADGMFDIAANGGGFLTINYEKDGYLTAQRQVDVPWQDYVRLPDVIMIPLDPQVTPVDLSASIAMQVARGSSVRDDDGDRQATLLLPEGTEAELVMPDGSTQSMTSLNIRATEYTVGDNGPEAMPAELPPTSFYTYCAELTCDEALAAGAETVRFNEPVLFYVENFMNFPTGIPVPVAYYDRDEAAWIPSDDGRVIKILSITANMADLDTDGDGLSDDAIALEQLGVTEAERQRLAELYDVGQSLWRVPVSHFTTYDCNYGVSAQAGSASPQLPLPISDAPCPFGGTCFSYGSIIERQNQILGEVIPIAGTPFRLHYSSDRVLGRVAARSMDIPVTGESVPSVLKGVRLEVRVAGREWKSDFPPVPNQVHYFEWDGVDAYGRLVQGQQPVTIRIGYDYDGYYNMPPKMARSFGYNSGTLVPGDIPAREKVMFWQDILTTIGPTDARAMGLGGWTLNVHHFYDPVRKELLMGDGSRRTGSSAMRGIETVAGTGEMFGFGKDGDPATEVALKFPVKMAVGADGTVYIPELMGARVRQVAPDGIMHTAAGTGRGGYSGDGGPADSAQLRNPCGVAIAGDGSLYIADSLNHCVRRVDGDGVITTVAGIGGVKGNSGNGGPATEALLNTPHDVALGSDGALYIADTYNYSIRKVSPDGIISNLAGNGEQGFGGDGGPATEAALFSPVAVEVARDGNVYIADMGNYRIRCVKTSGIIETVAGNGDGGFDGDGGPAVSAALGAPSDLVVTNRGELYTVIDTSHRVRVVTAQGSIYTFAGSGPIGASNGTFDGDGEDPTRARLNRPQGLALSPDGSLLVADTYNYRVRKIASVLPGSGYLSGVIPSEDGQYLYEFSEAGLHLRTVHALTGATIHGFHYDDQNRLIAVEDRDQNMIRIHRGADGAPIAVKAPFGQLTALSVDDNGYLERLTDPLGGEYSFAYSEGGLLQRMTDPRSFEHHFEYDAVGRVIRDEGPDGSLTQLERTATATGFAVSVITGQGNTANHLVEPLNGKGNRLVNTFACCAQNEVLFGTDGSTTVAYADGTATAAVQGSDPRFGMQAPLTQGIVTATPAGRLYRLTRERTATLTDPNDPLSLETLSETVTINDKTHTSTYNAGTRTRSEMSPEGRQSAATLDELGRPVEIRMPRLEPLSLSYDNHGRLKKMTNGTRESEFTYDETSGYLSSIANALEQTTSHVHDALGRTTSTTLANGTTWSYEHDKMGNLFLLTEPDGTTQHRFTYTSTNLFSAYRSPLGARDTFKYDKDKRLVQREFPSGRAIEWIYDSKGQLTTVKTPEGTHTFDHDAQSGLLVQEVSRDGQEVAYTYDGGLLTSATWSNLATGSVTYDFNNDFRVSQFSYAGLSLPVSYDDDGLLVGVGGIGLTRMGETGLLTGITDGSFQVSYSRSTYGEISSIMVAQGSNLYEVTYAYDALGRVSTKVQTIGGTTHTWDYQYSSVGQLITVKRDDVEVESYTYDSVGNRIGINNTLTGQDLTAGDFSYDADNKLLAAGNTSYTYDPDGRLHRKERNGTISTYHYNTDGTLAGVELPDGRQITYQHDVGGRRVARAVDGTRTHMWLYGEGLTPVAEYDGNGNLRTTFIYAGLATPVSMNRDESTFHIVTDHLGSPRLVVDDTGAVVKQVDYDAFGNVLNDTNPAFDLPFGFAGGMADPDHGLIRFGARDYQPSTGRWTTRDPILFAGGPNLYGYVGNDPVNSVDRDGEIAIGVALFILLVIVAGFLLYPDPLDIPSQGEDLKRMEFIFGTVTCLKGAKLIGLGGKGAVASSLKEAQKAADALYKLRMSGKGDMSTSLIIKMSETGQGRHALGQIADALKKSITKTSPYKTEKLAVLRKLLFEVERFAGKGY